ncbi:MAG: PAS domain-containing sensor histidine kinase [Aquificae bacterium]|nr:PAS domain-containing sensor histidine kinase [Aquificota bacterium]
MVDYWGVFDELGEQVVIIDRNYRIVYANESYVKQNGYCSREEVVGRACYEVSHRRSSPCEGECHPCPLREIERLGRSVSVIHTHYTQDGREVPVEICAFPMRDGKILQFIRNISDGNRFYLFSLHQKLSSVGFLALGLSHELSTPLTTIGLSLDELQKRFGNSEEIESIRRALNTCRSIVDRLLLLVRGSGRSSAVDLGRATLDVLELLGVYARKRGVELIPSVEEGVFLVGDEADFRHLVLNLVLNAIQASKEGGRVWVEVRKEKDRAIVRVRDEGEGIEKDEIDKIFLPFYKGKGKREGSGMGLAIVSEIVGRYGGYVRVESSPGEGSVFEVSFPLP